MPLPKIKHSAYKHRLKGIDKEISFRPYTNAEQKILLIAKEEAKEDRNRILDSITQILSNCILDNIDPYDLPIFDIEDIFVRIREKSVGEIIPIRMSYEYTDESGAKKTDFVKFEININDIKLDGVFDPKDRNIIVDTENNVGIKLRYPTLRDVKEIGDSENSDEDMLIRCIEFIYDAEEIYNPSDYTKEELKEFVSDIEGIPMLKIKKFFDTMPRLYYQTDVYKKHLDETETVKFRGLEAFFT